MTPTSQPSKIAVLHAFSVEANPNAETLAIYLKRYPQFREALIDLSIELFLAPSFDEVPAEDLPSQSTERAWSKFQSLINPEAPSSSIAKTNPLSTLDKKRFRELAGELNVNRLFLSFLRDNAIQVATIPRQLLEMLSKMLDVPFDSLQRTLEAPPTISEGARYKASAKPGASEKITFEEALTQSQLTEEQQSALRAMKD